MIRTDQLTCFPSDLLVAVSSKDDGTMLNRIRGRHVAEIIGGGFVIKLVLSMTTLFIT